MQLTIRNPLGLVCAALIAAAPLAAGAVDEPIPAKVAIVKSARLAKFVSKDPAGFTLPAPGSPEDPTENGAELRFFDTALGGAGTAAVGLCGGGGQGEALILTR